MPHPPIGIWGTWVSGTQARRIEKTQTIMFTIFYQAYEAWPT